jgi:hypothetical protein
MSRNRNVIAQRVRRAGGRPAASSPDLDKNVRQGKGASEPESLFQNVVEILPLWGLEIVEVTGHNLEARGREEVNRLLQSGWRLLHIYTLKYRENGVWRERPMAILGRLRHSREQSGE